MGKTMTIEDILYEANDYGYNMELEDLSKQIKQHCICLAKKAKPVEWQMHHSVDNLYRMEDIEKAILDAENG